MAHAFLDNPAAGRALSMSASILFCGAMLWGVSQMSITLPHIIAPPEGPPITTLTEAPPLADPRPKPFVPPKTEKPADEVTEVPFTPPVDTTLTSPEETGDTVLPPPMITNPTWIRSPNADDMMGLYPYGALERGISGRVVLDCLVGANGRISCAVASETPQGKGFGDAALKAARFFQIAPSMVDGRPTEGGRIRVPISFQPPRD